MIRYVKICGQYVVIKFNIAFMPVKVLLRMCINKAVYFQKKLKIKNADEKAREKFFMKKMKSKKRKG